MEKKKYNPDIHHRRTVRLKGYDYSLSGLYFITICTHNRQHLFGEISVGAGSKPALDDKSSQISNSVEDASILINEYGKIVENIWKDLINHSCGIVLHEFVIMPNHIHGIIEINNNTDLRKRAGLEPAPTKLSEEIRQLKTFSAKQINRLRDTPGIPVWQRDYYEHIIRDEQSYYLISEYIENNPMDWSSDKYYGSE